MRMLKSELIYGLSPKSDLSKHHLTSVSALGLAWWFPAKPYGLAFGRFFWATSPMSPHTVNIIGNLLN